MAAQALPDDRREQILRAALHVFADQGYKAATIKKIATQGGLKSPALLYWYFENKERLFQAVLLRYAAILGEQPAERGDFDQPPREFLGAAMGNWLARFADPDTLLAYRLLLLEVPALKAHGFSLDENRPSNLFRLLADYLQHQVVLGRLRPHDTKHSANAIVSMLALNLQARYSAILEPPPPDDEFIEKTLDLLLDGLATR